MSQWKDSNRGNTWEIQLPAVRVTVTRHINYGPDAWLLRCSPPLLDMVVLTSTDLLKAQREAMTVVLSWLIDATRVVRDARKELYSAKREKSGGQEDE